jgi:hypothetical protein
MKSNKEIQANHRQRKRDKGLVPKEVWIFPEDWEEIKELIEKKVNKRLDIITSNDMINST